MSQVYKINKVHGIIFPKQNIIEDIKKDLSKAIKATNINKEELFKNLQYQFPPNSIKNNNTSNELDRSVKELNYNYIKLGII